MGGEQAQGAMTKRNEKKKSQDSLPCTNLFFFGLGLLMMET
jgi:hypothetical protein